VRELDVDPAQCDALVSALAAAVAIAIDPPRFSRIAEGPVAPPAPPVPAPVPVPVPAPLPVPAPAAPPPPPAPAETPRVPLAPFAAAAAVATLAFLPSPALGIELGAGAEAARVVSRARGARRDRPSAIGRFCRAIASTRPRSRRSLSVFSSRTVGGLRCGSRRCPSRARAGRGASEPRIDVDRRARRARGARRSVLARSRREARRMLEAPLVRTSFQIGERTVWVAPPIAFSALVGIFFLPKWIRGDDDTPPRVALPEAQSAASILDPTRIFAASSTPSSPTCAARCGASVSVMRI